MKPIKNFEAISKWILRFALATYLICLFQGEIKTFDFKSLNYIVNLIYVLFGILLLFGGLAKGGTLTIISGILISIVSVYKIYISFSISSFTYPAPYIYLMIFGIGLFFVSKGNS